MNNKPYVLNNSHLLVDRSALLDNMAAIEKSLTGSAGIIPVLKADAYGLGMVPLAGLYEPLDAVPMLAVAHISEGIALREAAIRKDVLLLGNPAVHALAAGAAADLTFTVGRSGLLGLLADQSEDLGRPVKVQLKIDTGLHRVGAAPGEELSVLLSELTRAGERIALTGVYSHFADTADAQRCAGQAALYETGLDQVEKAGFDPGLRHLCDSAGSENYPLYHYDAVRLGRRLMMDHPTRPRGNIREAATWRTVITDIRRRSAGESLGYADACTLKRDSLVAILGVGYSDGLPVELARAHGPVLIRGRRCPLLECCMDQSFADVTDLPECEIGDSVTLFGYDEAGNVLTSQEAAAVCGANEGCGITSALSPRVVRIYVN